MTTFNDGQRRNEVLDRLDIEQLLGNQTIQSTLEKKKMSTAHAGTKAGSDNMNSMCFAEVQVLKLLLEHCELVS